MRLKRDKNNILLYYTTFKFLIKNLTYFDKYVYILTMSIFRKVFRYEV